MIVPSHSRLPQFKLRDERESQDNRIREMLCTVLIFPVKGFYHSFFSKNGPNPSICLGKLRLTNYLISAKILTNPSDYLGKRWLGADLKSIALHFYSIIPPSTPGESEVWHRFGLQNLTVKVWSRFGQSPVHKYPITRGYMRPRRLKNRFLKIAANQPTNLTKPFGQSEPKGSPLTYRSKHNSNNEPIGNLPQAIGSFPEGTK